jgi:recombinational DNA repair protein (RecF pathway)
MSHHIYNTTGLVIDSTPTGEGSGMYSVFTRELGMVRARAQGVRLQKSKLKPALQDFSVSELSLVRGREIWRIVNARSDHNLYQHFRGRQEAVLMLGRVFFIVRRLVAGEEKNEPLFDLLDRSFHFARENDLSPEQSRSFEYILVLKILDNLGYRGRDSRLERFANEPITIELITAMSDSPGLKNHAAAAINAALRESHL